MGYPKPANALSTIESVSESIGESTGEVTLLIEAAETPTITAPAELISRYATYSFYLTNGRSQPMYAFYTSPSNVNSWEEDLLGSSTLSSNGSVYVTIDASCCYDFKAVFSDGSSSTHYGVDICDLSEYVF